MSIAKTYVNYSADWWTPQPWLDWVSATIGGDWLDPCPGDWDGSVSGLDVAWDVATYCNRPGSRGSVAPWWHKYLIEQGHFAGRMRFVWCAFNVEGLRYMTPSPFHLSGWLVMPRERTSFVWGGETTEAREHGKPAKSPANWAVWWTNVAPATPPVDSVIVRTA